MSVAFYLCMLAKCVLWIAMISFSMSLFETRWPKNRIRIIGVILFYIVSYVKLRWGGENHSIVFITAWMIAGGYAFYYAVCLKGSRMERLLAFVAFTTIEVIVDVIAHHIMIHVIGLEMDNTWNSMKMLIPIGIAYPFIFGFESAMVLMWKLARKGFGKVKGKSRIGYRRILLIVSYVMLPVSQVLLIVGVSAAGETGDSWWYQEEMVFCVVGMLLSGLAFWIAVIQQFRQWRVQQRLAEEKIVYELQQRSNEVIEEQKYQMDTLRGAFRKELLRVLEQVRTDPETAKKEMESFRERLNRTRTVVYCVNDTVNAVVSKYARICEERGIRFEVRLEVDGLDGIRPIDLCSVFSNLLDNAVHACEKLQEQERWIRVLAGMKGDYVRILITNSAEAEEDKNLDGHYGQKIVREIAREYNGDFETEYQNGEYSASVILLKTV